MTQEFIRKLSLVVSNTSAADGFSNPNGKAIDFGQFWCTFTVRRGDDQTPNSLEARLYNVSDATVATIAKSEFYYVSLSAGYPGNVGVIFQGNIVQFRKGRVNQLDSYVDLTAADADQAYNYAYMSASMPAGSDLGGLLSLIQASFALHSGHQQITQGYAPQLPPRPLARSKVVFGMTRDVMRDFAKQYACKWSFQNGALTLIPYTSFIPTPAAGIPVISVATGLIGVPEQTQGGIAIRILLNPNIKVGQLIQLQTNAINQFRFGLDINSQRTNGALSSFNPLTGVTTPDFGLAGQIKVSGDGLYYVMRADHVGDTRGQDWYTDLTCLAVDATLYNNDATKALFFTAPPPIQRYGGT